MAEVNTQSIVTRCPKCGTAFRVTDKQLAVAKGAVRCGSCLNIFRALDHQHSQRTGTPPPKNHKNPLPDKPVKSNKAASSDKADRAKPTLEEEKIQDDISDNDVEAINEDFYFFDQEPELKQKKSGAFGDTSVKPVTTSSQEKADESWALEMLADLEDDEDIEPIIKPAPKPAAPPSEEEGEKRQEKETPGLASRFRRGKNKAGQAPEMPDPDEDFFYDENFDQQLDEAPAAMSEEFDDAHMPVEHIEARPLISDSDIDLATESSPSYKEEVQGFINGIQSAPVEMEYYEQNQTGKWLWRLLFLLLVILLLAQLVIFRFEQLSQNPDYRPWILTFCAKTGCTVPDTAQPEKVRVSNLVVRNHPQIANALLVDVILVNGSRTEQVYPVLLLEFSDINDLVLTQNRITPSSYLRGELAGAKAMPPQQPVQISITIQDPGDAATNYRLLPVEDDA